MPDELRKLVEIEKKADFKYWLARQECNGLGADGA